jgi:hypothetical protein
MHSVEASKVSRHLNGGMRVSVVDTNGSVARLVMMRPTAFSSNRSGSASSVGADRFVVPLGALIFIFPSTAQRAHFFGNASSSDALRFVGGSAHDRSVGASTAYGV